MANIENLFQNGHTLHQTGNLEEAAMLYRKVLEIQPEHVDANFLMGTLNLQQGNLDTASTFLKKTITLKPDDAMAYNNLAIVLQEQGKLDEAKESYCKAISLVPDYAEAHYNLANVLKEQGRLDEAIKSYEQAITLIPDYSEALCNLGNVLQEQGKPDEAIANFRQVIEIKPDYVEAYCNLGNALKEQDKLDEAVTIYNRAIAVNPQYANVHYNLGNALREQNRPDEAIVSYSRAIEIKQDYAEAYCNLGNVFQEQGKLDEAVERYRQAIEFKPNYALAHNNLGTMLQGLGQFDEAITSYDQAIEIKQDYAEAHMNRSLILLLTKNFQKGWSEYEWRLRTKIHSLRDFNQPKWDGSPLGGKSILVHAEQGLGDNIQFVRYLPMVKAKGGNVIFECQKDLFHLLKSCSGFDEIIEQIPHSKPSVQFDLQVPLLSLPGIFDTKLDTIPSDAPYISVDSNLVTQWCTRLGHNNTYKIGIVWAGSPTNKLGRNRTCSLSDFAPIAEIPDLTFYSLQKGPASLEANNPPKGMKIINLENELNNFTDTAAVIANLDLVISVDTAVVHLAGAIGKPVWTLLHFVPTWRWLLKRDDTPWYPGMRLFRQTQLNDWTGAFKQVKKALLYKLTTEQFVQQSRSNDHETSLKHSLA